MFFFFQAEDGIRDLVRSRGLGDVYKRQENEEFTKETQYYIELSNAYSAMITPAPGNVVIIVASQNISQGTVIKGDLMSFIQIPSNKYISVSYTHLTLPTSDLV